MSRGTLHTDRSERRRSLGEFLTVGVLGFAVGAAVGWLGEGLLRGERGRSDPSGLSAPADPEGAVDEGESRRNYGVWLARLEAMERRVVPEETFAYLALPSLDSEGRITEGIRELFFLADDEVEGLNRVIEETEARLVEAELDHLEVLGMTDEEAVFLIPAFDEGTEIEHSFREGVIEVLGEKDGELLWTLLVRNGTGEAPGRWRGFGRVDREISFTVRETDPQSFVPAFEGDADGSWVHYEERIRDEMLWVPGNDDGWRVEVGRVAAVVRDDANGPERYFDPDTERFGYLVPELPENLSRYFGE